MSANAVPSRPALLLIVGPTAVGKTELAIQLAKALGGEIISADSRLFYRGMDIGTAKPTPQELRQVPHHLIDIVNPDETVSLAVFQRMARDAISDVHRRGRLPLLVGGTGQYVRAVTEDWQPPAVAPDTRLRDELGRLKDARGVYWLHDRLRQLDSDAAREIDPRNARRTIRALEVILTTGRRFSAQRVHGQSPYHLITIGLNRPRPDLYARIDARIDAMFRAGLLDEVRGLLDAGYGADLPAMSAIGYRECVHVIQGEGDAERARAEMRRATRMYVRRQANWFKESDPTIRWFDAARPGLGASLADLIRKILHESGG
jgi:tRNA dimethylallyltransferase